MSWARFVMLTGVFHVVPIIALTVLGSTAGYVCAESPVTALERSSDSDVLAGSTAGVKRYSWPELDLRAELAVSVDNVHDLQFSPQGDRLLVAGGVPSEAGVIEVWRWPDGERVRVLDDHRDVVYQVAWSPTGRTFAAASSDGTCSVFDAELGTKVCHFDGHSRPVLTIAYLDAATLVSAGVDQTVRLWDAATGRAIRTLNNHLNTVNGMAVGPVSPDPQTGKLVTISEDRTVRLWQPRIGRMIRFARVPSAPRSVVWMAGGGRLCVGCNDGVVRFFDAESLEPIGEVNGRVGRIHELIPAPGQDMVLVGGELGVSTVDPESALEPSNGPTAK